MTPTLIDCPYGADTCPKVQELERDVTEMRKTMNKILYLLYFVAGIVAVEFGIVII